MSITNETLRHIYPLSIEDNRRKYLGPLNAAMDRYGITNKHRIRAFLAQVGHESGQLKTAVENLKYSAASLRAVFKKYFPTSALANQYARKPEAIANRVYANRMGNGNEASGEGWKYRGRGLIQITGKNNYDEASNKMYALPFGVDFVEEPELLQSPEYATQSAAWFWEHAGLNGLSDQLGGETETEVFTQITRKINGGTNGLQDRLNIYNRAKKFIV